MEDIANLAEQLGKAIAGSQQAVNLRETRKAMGGEEGLEETMKQYQQKAEQLQQKAQQSQPIEPAEKQEFEGLQNKLTASEGFKSFTQAQVEYVDLMRKVNQTLQKQLAEVEQG